MAQKCIGYGSTSVWVRIKLLDSSSTTGAGKTGLTNASAGLNIALTWDNEATATVYSGGNISGTITTLGTYQAPAASGCRFKEYDATNHPGVYEIHFLDSRFSVTGGKRLMLSIQATGVAQYDAEWEGLGGACFVPDGIFSAVGGATATLQSGQSYATNALAGRQVQITSGTGSGQTPLIVKSNTNANPSVLTFWATPTVTLDTTSQYTFGGTGDLFRAIQCETVGSFTVAQALSLILAATCGTNPAAGTRKTIDGTTTRLSGTVNGSGVRSSITATPSS